MILRNEIKFIVIPQRHCVVECSSYMYSITIVYSSPPGEAAGREHFSAARRLEDLRLFDVQGYRVVGGQQTQGECLCAMAYSYLQPNLSFLPVLKLTSTGVALLCPSPRSPNMSHLSTSGLQASMTIFVHSRNNHVCPVICFPSVRATVFTRVIIPRAPAVPHAMANLHSQRPAGKSRDQTQATTNCL